MSSLIILMALLFFGSLFWVGFVTIWAALISLLLVVFPSVVIHNHLDSFAIFIVYALIFLMSYYKKKKKKEIYLGVGTKEGKN
ncbi:hypothetical protein CI105_09370 [Candidatus Izimaplasma bacterium ZiA1]|nr:hypothetical protein CI105_09370 [Candidatus Izimaplasma bacterium ZiA1]